MDEESPAELDFHLVGGRGYCFASDASVQMEGPANAIVDIACTYVAPDQREEHAGGLCGQEGLPARLKELLRAPRPPWSAYDSSYQRSKHILRALLTIEAARTQSLELNATPRRDHGSIAFQWKSTVDKFEEVVTERRSCRERGGRLDFDGLSRILQFSLSRYNSHFPYASAGGIYGLRTYLITREPCCIGAGAYYYDPVSHELQRVSEERVDLTFWEALSKDYQMANMLFLLCHDTRAHVNKYGYRGYSFAMMEVGAALHALYLSSTKAKISCCAFGQIASCENHLRSFLREPIHHIPMAIFALLPEHEPGST